MTMLPEMPVYRYRGARAMVLLHEQFMRAAVADWRRAKAAGITLPQTADPDYQSLEHLLVHLVRASRGYMVWMCEQLELPEPGIPPAPPPERIEQEVDTYLGQLLAAWRLPLAAIDEARMSHPTYKSRWGMDYSVDSMLEHAVVHPLRHSFQLNELLA